MSWRGHTTTLSEDKIVRQLDALGMSDAVDLIEKLDNALLAAEERARDLDYTRLELEEKLQEREDKQ